VLFIWRVESSPSCRRVHDVQASLWLAMIFSLFVGFRSCGLPPNVFHICAAAIYVLSIVQFITVHGSVHCPTLLFATVLRISLFLKGLYGSLECLLPVWQSLAADSKVLQLSLQKNIFLCLNLIIVLGYLEGLFSMVPIEPLRDCPVIVVGNTACLYYSVLFHFRCTPPLSHKKFCIHFWNSSRSLLASGLQGYCSIPLPLSERRNAF